MPRNRPATFNRTRKFGLELECYGVDKNVVAEALNAAGVSCFVEGYNHTTRRHWKLVPDGSVGGEHPFELVSPPMRGESGLEKVRTVCRVLNELGVKVNRSCGFHVHHDAADLTLDNLKDVARLAFKYEPVTDFFVSPSRRNGNNRYCRGFLSGYYSLPGTGTPVERFQRGLRRARTREGLAFDFQHERFVTLNFVALTVHGTVEFRQHQGTTDAEKVISWVVWTQWLLERAKRGRVTLRSRLDGNYSTATQMFRVTDWYNLEDEVVKKAKKFLTRRFKKFKRAVEGPVPPEGTTPRRRRSRATERGAGTIRITPPNN